MFSLKICPWSFYAILAAIFIAQPFFQPADGNDEFVRIVKTFIGKVEELKVSHSQQGIHAKEEVVTNLHDALRNILFSDIVTLHQFLLEYKQFLHNSPKHYATATYFIKECDANIKILENLQKDIKRFLHFDNLPDIIRNCESIKGDIANNNPSRSKIVIREIETLGQAIDDVLKPLLQRMKHVENWRKCGNTESSLVKHSIKLEQNEKVVMTIMNKWIVRVEGNMKEFISDKFSGRREHLNKAAKEYSEKYKELMPKLKETDTKMPKEMEQVEDYVSLRKSVDPSLMNEIEAELHGIEATSPAESVTEMGSPAADKQLGNRWFRWFFTGKKEIPAPAEIPASDPSLSPKVELLEAFLAFLKAVEMNQKVLEMLSHHNLLYDFEHLIKASMLLGNCLEAQIERLLGINVSDEHLEEDRADRAKCFVLAKAIVEPAFHKLKSAAIQHGTILDDDYPKLLLRSQIILEVKSLLDISIFGETIGKQEFFQSDIAGNEGKGKLQEELHNEIKMPFPRLDANVLPKYLTELALAEWNQKNKITKADETEQHLGREMGKATLGHSPNAAAASSSSSNTVGKKDDK